MTRREIATLACRILALYMLLRAFDNLATGLPLILSSMGSPSEQRFLGGMFLALGLYGFLAGLLWSFAGGIATLLIGSESSAKITTQLSANEILFLTFALVGVMGVVNFTTQIAYLLGNVMAGWMSDGYLGMNGQTFSALAQLLLSTGLLLGARPLANMIEAHGAAKKMRKKQEE